MKLEKGYTLIEMVIVLLLIGIVGSGIMISYKEAGRVALETTAHQIVQAIEYAKQAAAISGQQYNVLILDDHVSIRNERSDATHTIYLTQNQELKAPNLKDYMIVFAGDISTHDAQTLKIIDKSIKRQARITIDVATSKVRVYYEKI